MKPGETKVQSSLRIKISVNNLQKLNVRSLLLTVL